MTSRRYSLIRQLVDRGDDTIRQVEGVTTRTKGTARRQPQN